MTHSTPTEHAQHDLELIAGHAAGDLSHPDQARADALLRSCTSCADLRSDLVAIAQATRSLPALPSPHDFQLSEAQAASLRRGGWIKSLLRPFAAPGSAVRPVAMALTSLGLAGLLVTNILPALLGGFGSAGALAPAAGPGGGLTASTAAPAPAASAAAAGTEAPLPIRGAGEPQATRQNDNAFGSLGQPTAAAAGEGSKADVATNEPEVAFGGGDSSTAGPYAADRLTQVERDLVDEESNPVVVGSLLLLAVGLGLLALRFVARRVR